MLFTNNTCLSLWHSTLDADCIMHTNITAFANCGVLFWKSRGVFCVSLSNLLCSLTQITPRSSLTKYTRCLDNWCMSLDNYCMSQTGCGGVNDTVGQQRRRQPKGRLSSTALQRLVWTVEAWSLNWRSAAAIRFTRHCEVCECEAVVKFMHVWYV